MLTTRNCIILYSAVFFLFLFAGCSSDTKTAEDKIVAKINDFELTQEEFQKKLVKEIEYSDAYKTTADAKKEFLDSIIKKELLIQEAVRLGLDKKQDFISAIEKYWEATLIKQLMEEKSREIQKIAAVSEKEIQKKYAEIKASKKEIPPLESIEKEIAAELLEARKTAILNKWIASLYKNSKIDINMKLINE